MSILDRFRKQQNFSEKRENESPDDLFERAANYVDGLANSPLDLVTSGKKANRTPATAAGKRLISGTVARLPLHIYEVNEENGNRGRIFSHPVLRAWKLSLIHI